MFTDKLFCLGIMFICKTKTEHFEVQYCMLKYHEQKTIVYILISCINHQYTGKFAIHHFL